MDTANPVIRLLIADDHTLVRQGIRLLLETQPDFQVVGEASDGAQVVQMANELHPDIVVMDLAMPNMDGIEATRAIKRGVPETQILALTMYENDEYFFKMLEAGAAGYVLKRAAAHELIAALRAVDHGEVVLSPTLIKKLVIDYVGRTQAGEGHAVPPNVTAREQEVLTLIAEGYSNREIAERLGVSLSTVQTHYAHLIEKLNLRNRTELVKYALRHGLIRSSPD
jgi:DNA-binding NarL/FixJ family response regulator